MVFSSVPLFLDPSNWHQEQLPSHHETPQHRSTDHGGGDDVHSQQPAEQPGCGGGGGSSSIRPGSMADRARLAKIPLPEAGLKCPRCESANTKFCYFNNYSLSQPRHFCKTCRRYWTRGGALRSVPVGGGCRRNKRRSKGGNNNNNSNNRSKSPINTAPSSSSNYIGLGSNSCTTHLATGHINIPPQITQNFPILSPLYSLVDYNSADIGLNYSGVQPPAAASGGEFQIGTTNPSGVGGSMLSNNGFMEQFKSMQLQGQQFPMFANLDPPAISSALFGFEQGVLSVDNNYVGQYRSKLPLMDTGITQRAAIDVKIEENSSRDVLDITRNNNNNNNNNDNNNNNQFWDSNGNGNGDGSGNGWSSPDFLGFTSSTSSRLL